MISSISILTHSPNLATLKHLILSLAAPEWLFIPPKKALVAFFNSLSSGESLSVLGAEVLGVLVVPSCASESLLEAEAENPSLELDDPDE